MGPELGPFFVLQRTRLFYIFLSRGSPSDNHLFCPDLPLHTPALYPYTESGMKAGAASYKKNIKRETSGVHFYNFWDKFNITKNIHCWINFFNLNILIHQTEKKSSRNFTQLLAKLRHIDKLKIISFLHSHHMRRYQIYVKNDF